jgi:hypothetical protein
MRPAWTLLMLLPALCACDDDPASPAVQPPLTPSVAVGGDRDAHGCIGSAGYVWCERTQRCERPWELAQAKGFPLGPEGFRTYCGNKK